MMSTIFLFFLYSIKLGIVSMAVLAVPVLMATFLGEIGGLKDLISMLTAPDMLHELLGDVRVFGGMAEAFFKGNLAGQMKLSVINEFIQSLAFVVMLMVSYDVICIVSTLADRLTFPLQGMTGWIDALCRGYLKYIEVISAALLANLFKYVFYRYIQDDGIGVAVIILVLFAAIYLISSWWNNRGKLMGIAIKLVRGVLDVALIYAVVFFMSQLSQLDQASAGWTAFVIMGFFASLMTLVILESQKLASAFSK